MHRSGRGFLVLLLAVAFLWAAPAVHAEEGDGDGPVFLFISLVEDFDTGLEGWTWDSECEKWVCTTCTCTCTCDCESCDCESAEECGCECCSCTCDGESCDGECTEECCSECCSCTCDCGDGPVGSAVLLVPLGMFVAGGEEVSDATFEPNVMPPEFSFGEEEDPEEHQFAILGSFDTSGENTIHLVSPGGGFIPAGVQEAFFNASNAAITMGVPPNTTTVIGFDNLGTEATTVEIAMFIYEHGGSGGTTPATGTTPPEIMIYIFTPQDAPESPDGEPPPPANPGLMCQSPCMAEGDLFAHEGDDIAEFGFHLAFNPANFQDSFTASVCEPVDVDIKPGGTPNSVNLKSKGKLTIAILGSDTLDVTEIDEETVAVVGTFIDENDDPVEVSVGPVVKNNGTLQCAIEDVDDDGDDDLVCHFSIPELKGEGLLDPDSTELTIRANIGASCIEGTDSVSIVNK